MSRAPRYATPMDEVVDRLRRLETRLTVYMTENGFDTQTKRPTMTNGYECVIPNINVSIKDVLAVSNTWEEFPLVLHGKTVAYMRKVDE